jgi:adenylate cyclase
MGRPYYLTLLADAYAQAGDPATGLTALEEAIATVEQRGEYFCQEELYRLKGELTLQKFQVPGFKFQVADPPSLIPDPYSEAEACFLKALEISHSQQAKSLELRAATSLARLWRQQGKRHEARNMLAEIYGWFTEGFTTPDLRVAKALLVELASLDE